MRQSLPKSPPRLPSLSARGDAMKQETSNETDSTQIRPPASPLFPPPSSSFRPPPPLETAGASKPEERSTTSPSIKGKGRRTVSVDLSGLHRPTSNQDSNALPPSISRPGSVSLSRSNSSAVSRRARSGSVASSRASPRIDHEIPDQSSHHLAHVHSSLSTVVDSLSRHTSKPSSPILLSPLAPMMSPSTSTLNHQPIIIRDFAFGPIDPRFAGLPHPDAATKRMSASSSSTSRKSGGEEEAIAGGGSVFSWGFVTCHQTDFPLESDGSQGYSNEEGEAGEGFDDDEGEGSPFVPGLYEALFDFEPELDTEMRIKAGDVVTVFARKCAGWVEAGRIAESDVVAEIGLIPENYVALLEPTEEGEWGEVEEVEVDEDEDEDRRMNQGSVEISTIAAMSLNTPSTVKEEPPV